MRAEAGSAAADRAPGRNRSLRGTHNAQERRLRGGGRARDRARPKTIQQGLWSFPASPIAWRRSGARATSCSSTTPKATNADAAARALACFDDIFWIAGGKPKTGGIAPLAEFFPRIRKAYLVGEAAQDFTATLGPAVPHVDRGHARARGGGGGQRCRGVGLGKAPVVLLSPACASSTSIGISRCGGRLPGRWRDRSPGSCRPVNLTAVKARPRR